MPRIDSCWHHRPHFQARFGDLEKVSCRGENRIAGDDVKHLAHVCVGEHQTGHGR